MDAQIGNEPKPQASEQPASAMLPDEIVRKQQALRRHLLGLFSPPFDDPVLAGELAVLVSTVLHRGTSDADGQHWLFRNTQSIRGVVDAALFRRAGTIEKVRRRIAEGMDAIKIVTVRDREGVRHCVEIPDHAARHKWAHFAAEVENLFPTNNDSDSDMLLHDAAEALELEKTRSVEGKLSRLSSADRFIVSNHLLKLKHLRENVRDKLIERKLGKPATEFLKEVEEETTVEMHQLLSSVINESVGEEEKSDV